VDAKEKAGPEDEYGALRAQLVIGLRRQPADTRTLARIAATLSRIETAQGLGSRRGRRELGERVGSRR